MTTATVPLTSLTVSVITSLGTTVGQATSGNGRVSMLVGVSGGVYTIVCTGAAGTSVTVTLSGAIALTQTLTLR